MEANLSTVSESTSSVGLPPDAGPAAARTGKAPQVKLLNVQILRAYAAFAVVFFHTGFHRGLPRPLGRFGVDTFFVISGFMMAYICATNPRNFFLRRVARIVPLYWLATFAVFFLAIAAPRFLQATQASSVHLLKSLFFIPFLKSDGLVQPMLFVGWSINYEMYFYVIIALALLLTRRYAAVLSAFLLTGIFAVLHVLPITSKVLQFFGEPLIFEFLLGMVCFWFFHRLPRAAVTQYRYLILLLGIAGLIGQPLFAIYSPLHPVACAIGLQLAAMCMVLSAVLLDRIGFSLRVAALVLLGDASYATYLTHFYCVGAIGAAAGKIGSVFLQRDHLAGMLLCLIFAHLVGVAVYLAVDKPAHTWFRRRLD
ncbi:acyltransferase family protein [Paracidobacterium acidisoli]|uniref:Acyltransferase n=1 Tax=Paracidobacterium acidisoli TaxID=2303751 RepID=A0A372IRL2_9BACT|nr:acyltransferase [Paracidobacterium acidisoli]MBT9330457.1 acyltransferase [Paracidobacterium acidisoli]